MNNNGLSLSKSEEDLELSFFDNIRLEIAKYINDVDNVYFSYRYASLYDYWKNKINDLCIDEVSKYNKKIYIGGVEDNYKNDKVEIIDHKNRIFKNIVSNRSMIELDTEYEKQTYKEISESYQLKIPVEYENDYIKYFIYSIGDDAFCTKRCAFCYLGDNKNTINKNLLNKKYIKDKLENINIFNKQEFNACLLLDSHITDLNLLDTLCNYISRKNIKMDFLCGARLSNINDDVVVLLEEVGVKVLNVGIEALDNNHRKYIRKDLSYDKMIESLVKLKKSNIFTVSNFIFGMPYSVNNEIELTTEFLQKDLLDDHVCRLYYMASYSPFISKPDLFDIKIHNVDGLPLYSENNRLNSINSVYSNISKNIPKILKSTNLNYHRFQMFPTNLILMLYKIYKNKNLVVNLYNSLKNDYI